MEELLKTAVEAALKGGEILKKGFRQKVAYSTKEFTSEIVSVYDSRSEKAIVNVIKKKYRNSSFILEEGGTHMRKDGNLLWLIDPLDGTTNFVRNIPFFAVSIAAMVDHEVVVGVIYHPVTNELYTAIRGKGAFLNGKRITVGPKKPLKELMIATRFPTNPKEDQLTYRFLKRLFDRGLRVRDFGASALEMAYLAAGKLDGFFISRPKSWDIAAGVLLIEEAGGVIEFRHPKHCTILSPRNLFAGGSFIDC